MAEKRNKTPLRGFVIATATFVGIQFAKWPTANLPEWQGLAVEFVGGLIAYYLAVFILGRFATAKEAASQVIR